MTGLEAETLTICALYEAHGMAELDARIPCTAETRMAVRRRREEGERYEDVLKRLLRETDGNA